MSTVLSVEAKGEKAAILIMDDGQRVWTPEKDKADALVGKPIPSDWTLKEGNFGPQAFPPRQGGGGAPAAFRNTKDGFFAEQESIHRSVALDKAIAFHAMKVEPPTVTQLLATADKLKTWLSGTKPLPGAGKDGAAIHQESSHSGGSVPSSPAPDEGGGKAQNRTHTEGDSASPAGTQETLGEGSSGPAGVCAHIDTSPLKPDGAALPRGFVRCLACGVVHKEAK